MSLLPPSTCALVYIPALFPLLVDTTWSLSWHMLPIHALALAVTGDDVFTGEGRTSDLPPAGVTIQQFGLYI